ncbi:MAG: hypothetical protein K9J25_00825 [Bacteroidales bacterium]|nr:hypothetical protein [Bacteroidales bacterium]
MEYLLKKLNYRKQDRICILNSNNGFIEEINRAVPGIKIDKQIDPKYLYDFCIVFVRSFTDLREAAPQSIHNLSEDGILWFAYPKKSSNKYESEISRDHGWDLVNSHGFRPVRQVSIDKDWTAIRFRNTRFINRNRSQAG